MSNLPDLSGRTILQVIPALQAGGAERTVIEISDAIVRAGGRALVTSTGGRMVSALEAVGGTHIEFDAASKSPLAVWNNSKHLADLIATENVSLIHARSRAPGWSAYRAARLSKTPFVTTYHGAYSGLKGLKRKYNSIMASGDMVIANSRWMAEHIAEVHGLSANQIMIIPRGVDFDTFDPEKISADRRAQIRSAWGLGPENKRCVLFFPARLTEWKGQKLALEALSLMTPEEHDQLVLVMTGEAKRKSSYITELNDLIRKYGLLDATRVLGHCEDMPAALSASDIVLAPSIRPEAFGRTAAEAAAMGRPVIAADHGGARETVVDGETGARFTAGNAQALTGAIRSLISVGPATRDTMGQNGRQHVEQHFSTKGLQTATLSLYNAVIGIRRPETG